MSARAGDARSPPRVEQLRRLCRRVPAAPEGGRPVRHRHPRCRSSRTAGGHGRHRSDGSPAGARRRDRSFLEHRHVPEHLAHGHAVRGAVHRRDRARLPDAGWKSGRRTTRWTSTRPRSATASSSRRHRASSVTRTRATEEAVQDGLYWDFTPTRTGTYTFFCRIHPSMRGAIRVVK